MHDSIENIIHDAIGFLQDSYPANKTWLVPSAYTKTKSKTLPTIQANLPPLPTTTSESKKETKTPIDPTLTV